MDPRRYFEEIVAKWHVTTWRNNRQFASILEVTNRCNLLCETCPRTFEDLEPPAGS